MHILTEGTVLTLLEMHSSSPLMKSKSVSSAPPHASPWAELEAGSLPGRPLFFSFLFFFFLESKLLYTHTTTLNSPMLQPNTVRYSLTAAVTECSEWTADNAISSSTCCLCARAHTHTHLIYLNQGYCQCMCQRYRSLFRPGTVQQLKDGSKRSRFVCACAGVWCL